MPRPAALLDLIALDRRTHIPLHRQLYAALRQVILDSHLRPGTRLPASRALAADLGVSRNTVTQAFDQLAAEGYLEARVGSGTRVAAISPEALLLVRRAAPGRAAKRAPAPEAASSSRIGQHGSASLARSAEQAGGARAHALPRLSRRGAVLASIRRPVPSGHLAFQPGLPALDAFPSEVWSRLLARRARRPRLDGFGYAHAWGHPALREAIAGYLGAARGVRCLPEQVLVLSGAQAGLDLVARMLLDPGDAAWLEDPGYLGARAALAGAGARLVGVPVDAAGLDVAAGVRLCPVPRLVYVTPSHQYPTGATMTLPRRLALLDHALRAQAWILEDDYDSEYRYTGRPLAALQGLDRAGIVLYLGTFSKTMFPALRAGYLIVPDSLSDAFAAAIRQTGQSVPTALQTALADFIVEGHFAAHVRRTRLLYGARQACLIESLDRHLAGALHVRAAEAGMQLAATLQPPLDDVATAAAASEYGVVAPPLSRCCLTDRGYGGLHLGYAAVPEASIPRAVERLARAIESLTPPPARDVGARRLRLPALAARPPPRARSLSG